MVMGFLDGSGIRWTMRKQSAPRYRQITTDKFPIIFTGQMLFLTPNQQYQKLLGHISTISTI